MEINVRITADPALMALLENLGKTLLVFGNDITSITSEKELDRSPSFYTDAASSLPVGAPMAAPDLPIAPVAAPSAPITSITPVVSAIPTAPAHAYTISELGVAGAAIAEAGKREEIIRILREQFGVEALTQLAPDKYPQFASALRALGAKI